MSGPDSSREVGQDDFLFHLYRGSELLQDNHILEAKQESVARKLRQFLQAELEIVRTIEETGAPALAGAASAETRRSPKTSNQSRRPLRKTRMRSQGQRNTALNLQCLSRGYQCGQSGNGSRYAKCFDSR